MVTQSSFLENHGNKILQSRGIIWGFCGLWGMNMKKIMNVTNSSCQLRGYLIQDDPPFFLSMFCVVSSF